MSSIKIKVCGLTDPIDALTCIEAGVDWVGLNFHPMSPRYVDPNTARLICNSLMGRAAAVGLFVNRTPRDVATVARAAGIEIVQLHGDEPPEDLLALQGLRVVKAFRLKGPESLDEVKAYVDRAESLGSPPYAILVDAYHAGLAGGTGLAIDGDLLSRLPDHTRLILAGGLNPSTVADRIAQARPRPWMVDVASGVESSPGKKSPEQIKLFVKAVQGAAIRP